MNSHNKMVDFYVESDSQCTDVCCEDRLVPFNNWYAEITHKKSLIYTLELEILED